MTKSHLEKYENVLFTNLPNILNTSAKIDGMSSRNSCEKIKKQTMFLMDKPIKGLFKNKFLTALKLISNQSIL